MTELTWKGKYTQDGKKVSPLKVMLPFQTVETVNESTPERLQTLELFTRGKPSAWRNRLIWGDKKYVLPSLLPEFAGKVNLIYIDPPFDTGADFSFTAQVPAYEDEGSAVSFVKQPSLLEQKAYRDTWGKGLDSYLQWFYETVVLLRELLAENGSIYVHLDWHVGHYAKCVLDEVFGYENFVNEIVWKRTTAHSDAKQGAQFYGRQHDVIMFYTKSTNFTWNQQYIPYDEEYINLNYRMVDEKGRRFQPVDLTAAKQGGDTSYEWKGYKLKSGRYWAYSKENMEKFENEGRIYYTKSGLPRLKYFLDEMQGVPVQDLWFDVKLLSSQSKERVNYPTQKPEVLLERIIKVSSNENDLILDCFCGSGTTAAVAEKLNRRWIACDLGRFAIHTTRKRLLSNPAVKPFCVQNLGKYERQHWMTTELGHDTALQHLQAYRHFMLDLYHAEPLQNYTWLHGKKGQRIVHVGAVDAPISYGDIQAIIKEFWQNIGKNTEFATNGLDILGWDFAFELHETIQQLAHANKIDLKFKRIPREVLEKRAVDQGDIKFFELAALGVKVTVNTRKLTLTLENFIIVPDDVPQDVKITHWSQWIDYWAVDFDYKNDTFHNEWQSYRTKKNPKIDLEVTHTYKESAKYVVMVKVIDILGNDTTKRVEVSV